MVLLMAVSYGLQLFNEEKQANLELGVLPFSSENGPSDFRAAFKVGQTDLQQANRRLKNGDIVFRAGDTWLTNVAEQFASELTYTHVGVITLEGRQAKVVHASIEGNSLAETLGNRVVEEPLADFLQRGNTTHAAVYRLKDDVAERANAERANVKQASGKQASGKSASGKQSSDQPNANPQIRVDAISKSAAKVAKTYAKKATPFDSGFDLATADRVYCTELIWRAYLDAGVDLSDQGLESFDFPFSGQYLTPDSLSKSVNLEPVYQFNQIRAVQSPTP